MTDVITSVERRFCRTCGCQGIVHDANVSWNPASREFEFDGEWSPSSYCPQCETETGVAEDTVEMPVWVRPTVDQWTRAVARGVTVLGYVEWTDRLLLQHMSLHVDLEGNVAISDD